MRFYQKKTARSVIDRRFFRYEITVSLHREDGSRALGIVIQCDEAARPVHDLYELFVVVPEGFILLFKFVDLFLERFDFFVCHFSSLLPSE